LPPWSSFAPIPVAVLFVIVEPITRTVACRIEMPPPFAHWLASIVELTM
jgi:hypothetical protein